MDVKIGDIVTLTGRNKRGKDRVNNFGPKFILKSFPIPCQEGCMLFESVEKTFRLGERMTTWSGWLEPNVEVDIDEVHI